MLLFAGSQTIGRSFKAKSAARLGCSLSHAKKDGFNLRQWKAEGKLSLQ
jgi:hypothetical protein